jgi:FkbM family methyltransferase
MVLNEKIMSNPNVLINSDYGSIIININDSVIGRHISQLGYWAKDDIELIKKLVDFLLTKKESVTFYDVGSNIGTHALAIGKTYGEKVKVRAFEAQRQIFNMLCGTVALNGLSNIFCHNLAVSDGSQEKINIPLPDYHAVNNFGGLELIQPLRSDNQAMVKNNFEEVATTTLDDFNEVVDFIKMDIEGMEDKAFMGAKMILEKYRPICFIEILKTDVEFLINIFKEMGYLGFQKNADLIFIPAEHLIQINGLNRIL